MILLMIFFCVIMQLDNENMEEEFHQDRQNNFSQGAGKDS